MRLHRLFTILDRLRLARTPIAAENLAESMGVSLRTMYRDMATLKDIGAPIRGEGGVGYQLEPGYFLPPLHFDEDELDAVILGMKLVGARGDGPLSEAAARALSKVRAAVSNKHKREVANAPLGAFSTKERSGSAIRFLSPLRKAIRQRDKVDLRYRDAQGHDTNRRIRPLGLTAFDAVWCLTAWCETRQAFRNFRIDRIQGMDATGEHFSSEQGKEFGDYIESLA